jgi:Tol biopolymer transport system component
MRSILRLAAIAPVASLLVAIPATFASPPVPQRGALSPAAIVFARLQGDPDNYEIWTMGQHGADQERLTRNSVADHDPEWSPDGSQIAWVRYESRYNTGPSDVWLMDPDGSNQHKLTDHSDDVSGPSWSPDGTRLVFARNDGLWIIDTDGTDEHRIAPARMFARDPAWSPDGSRIVFSAHPSRTRDLYVTNVDGSERGRLSRTDGIFEYAPAWSPDGSRIASSGSHLTSTWHVDLMRSDGEGVHILIDLYSLDPAWSPDGSKLAFYACAPDDCGLYQSGASGKHIRELGRRRGFSDIQPDFRTAPTP